MEPGRFSTKTDIWAFGCVLFSLATTGRGEAFKSDFDVVAFKKGYVGTSVPQLSDKDIERLGLTGTSSEYDGHGKRLNEVLAGCFATKLEDRPTAQQLKEVFEELRGVFQKGGREIM
jgi:serine/threonine protein kinase